MFWQRRGADQSGFDCSTTVAAPAFVDGALEIRRVCPETPDREAGRDVWIFPDPDLHAVLPSAEQRFRVLGNPDPEGFLMSGATDFHRLDAAVLAVSGRHLRESMQLRWLEELSRVTARGAWLLMTVHGVTAAEYLRLEPGQYGSFMRRLASEGIVVTGANSQIDGHAEHLGEYVNVHHDSAYVRRVWSDYFEVVAVLPGYVFTHDLVVLRKR